MPLRATSVVVAGLLLAAPKTALGFAPDGCEQQRALYPRVWSDASSEKALFVCRSPGARSWRVKIGGADKAGRTPMSLVPLKSDRRKHPIDDAKGIRRIWLDQEQTRRLRQGQYFATIVRAEDSCWIRGSLGEDDFLFLMDPGRAPSSGSEGEGVVRTSSLDGRAYRCRPAMSGETVAAPAPLPASCAQQRAQYPRDWADVAGEETLFACGLRGRWWTIRLGPVDAAGRAMLSVVPATSDGAPRTDQAPAEEVYRAWLDREQSERLREGSYFATILRAEQSCWIDGRLTDGWPIMIDAADPPADRPDQGAFYNKAPRMSIFNGGARCERAKKAP
jgi:hypothetical protein